MDQSFDWAHDDVSPQVATGFPPRSHAGAEERDGKKTGEKSMQLKDYFEFLGPDDIRIKGTRVGIETILSEYLDGRIPEEVALRYPSVSLEQVYATITYYLHNRSEIEAYLEKGRSYEEQMWLAQQQNPPEVVKRLRLIAQKRREELWAQSAGSER